MISGTVPPVDYEIYGKLLTGIAADRPAAGTADRWYYSTDTLVLEYDTAVAWVEAARGETAEQALAFALSS